MVSSKLAFDAIIFEAVFSSTLSLEKDIFYSITHPG